MSISSLLVATSGLYASQKGLQVTGHNISNVNNTRYTRQQALLQDERYRQVSQGMQVGLGVNLQEIRQIRDRFMDASYRQEFGRYNFYYEQQKALEEIQNIFAYDSDDSFGTTLSNFWESLNELSKHPEGLETRALFVQNAALLVAEANKISEQLYNYQMNLNTKIKETINKINGITNEIYKLNEKISQAESLGDNANDYRDERNALLDELSGLIQISYKENTNGKVEILAESYPLLKDEYINVIGYTQVTSMSPLIKPIWTDSNRDVINMDKVISPLNKNDSGVLKSLMYLRGEEEANWISQDSVVNKYTIPKIQKQFDTLIHDVVTMVNDVIAPQSHADGPIGLDGSQYIEIFRRKNIDRYDALGNYIPEDPTDTNTLYTARNIELNPIIITDYNKICISADNKIGDNSVVEVIINKWNDERIALNEGELNLNYNDYYSQFITALGNKGNEAISYAENQNTLVNQVNNQRSQIAGVSLDEEMTNMMKFQHAYNASARVITIIDGMLDTIINKM